MPGEQPSQPQHHETLVSEPFPRVTLKAAAAMMLRGTSRMRGLDK
jgi:hypothetical protein